jgi:pimeloyl-ACP methyl ester carboxylesterase
VAVLAAAALLLSGCTAAAAPKKVNFSDNSIQSMRPDKSTALDKYYDQQVDWRNCGGRYYCGELHVPLDWQAVTSKSIHIALIKHVASGFSEGSILVDPGGPGESGVDLVNYGVTNAVDSNLAKHYDIVGFDPRGVGQSSSVKCFSNKENDKYLYSIDPNPIGSEVWVGDQMARAEDFAAACDKATGPLLGQIDTVSAAKDMDVIRAALGESKLNYLGYSYGTFLGTVYAGLFPSNTGRFVFDGADDPWGGSGGGSDGRPAGVRLAASGYDVSPADDGDVEQAVGFEGDFDAYLRSCVAGAREALGKSGPCPFRGTYAAAHASVEREFATITAHPLSGSDGRKIGGDNLATAIDDALYDTTDWPHLTRMFTQLQNGNAQEAFALADDYNDREPDGTYDDKSNLANLAIGCLEDGHDFDLEFDAAELVELKKVAPILGPYSAYGDIACSGWQYGPTAFPDRIHAAGTGPILVVGTTGDPATPYSDAQELAKQLDGGHLVTFHGEGHTAYDKGDKCIDRTVDDYFIDGTVPRKDPQCH